MQEGGTISTEQSIADRIIDIRVRLGSQRKPLPYQKLAELLLERTGVRVSWESLRRYDSQEGGEAREPPLEIIRAIAAIDPLERGHAWLAFGDRPTESVESTPQPSAKLRRVAVLPHEKLDDGKGRRGA